MLNFINDIRCVVTKHVAFKTRYVPCSGNAVDECLAITV